MLYNDFGATLTISARPRCSRTRTTARRVFGDANRSRWHEQPAAAFAAPTRDGVTPFVSGCGSYTRKGLYSWPPRRACRSRPSAHVRELKKTTCLLASTYRSGPPGPKCAGLGVLQGWIGRVRQVEWGCLCHRSSVGTHDVFSGLFQCQRSMLFVITEEPQRRLPVLVVVPGSSPRLQGSERRVIATCNAPLTTHRHHQPPQLMRSDLGHENPLRFYIFPTASPPALARRDVSDLQALLVRR